MLFLILDTNIWLYLANGLDPITNKHHDNLHFELLKTLKFHKEQNEICILINDIVIEEWKRNKEHSKLNIKKLTCKLSKSDNPFNDIKKYVKSGIDTLQTEYAEGVKLEITTNEEHIQKVEQFLYNDCQKVEITPDLKMQIFDMSISRKAPFHNRKNNIADAAILLSAAQYLGNRHWSEDSSAIFVSNNVDDFTDGKNRDEFHSEIKALLNHADITYQRILPAALKLSKEIIIQIDEHHKHEVWLNCISFKCMTSWCVESESHIPIGYLDKSIKVNYESEERRDPNQQELFFAEMPRIKREDKIVSYGHCLYCSTVHVSCPKCGELTYDEGNSDYFRCTICSASLKVKYDDREGTICLFVNDTGEEWQEPDK